MRTGLASVTAVRASASACLRACSISCSRGREHLDGLGDQSRSCRLPCDRPVRARARPDRPRARPRARTSALPNTSISTAPPRSSSVANIIGSPLRVRIRLASTMIPPTVTQSLSRRSASAGQLSSRCGRAAISRSGLSGCAETNRPIASFSTASSSRLLELLGRDRRVGGRANAPPGRAGARRAHRAGSPPTRRVTRDAGRGCATRIGFEVEDRALTDLRVLLGLLARGLRLLEHREHALAAGPGGAERAALDQRLDRLLVDRAAVHALAEVPQRA